MDTSICRKFKIPVYYNRCTIVPDSPFQFSNARVGNPNKWYIRCQEIDLSSNQIIFYDSLFLGHQIPSFPKHFVITDPQIFTRRGVPLVPKLKQKFWVRGPILSIIFKKYNLLDSFLCKFFLVWCRFHLIINILKIFAQTKTSEI